MDLIRAFWQLSIFPGSSVMHSWRGTAVWWHPGDQEKGNMWVDQTFIFLVSIIAKTGYCSCMVYLVEM